MDFEWDPSKAHANQRKHRVSFSEAAEIFGDHHSSCAPDPDHSEGEERFLIFGVTSSGNHLVVSFTEKQHAIRIISARQMTRQERKAYEQ